MIADRMSRICASGIRRVFDMARDMKNPVDLSIGQPDFDIPEPVRAEGVKWIEKGFNRYTPTQGIADLISALHADIQKRHHRTFEDVLVTSGTSGGLFLALMALVNPGDEVVFADPYFVMYKHLVNLIGGVPVFVDTYPDFELTAARIEPRLSPKTKIIIINSPANPTGIVCREQTLKDIAELARRRGILVFSDEIYESFSYDGPCPSIASVYENVLLIKGFSKSHAMTGWRVGYVAGAKAIIQEMAKLQQYSFVCAPSFSQKAAIKALSVDTAAATADYRRKRDLIYDGIKGTYEVTRPGGAFYIFPKVPGGLTGEEFVKKAIAHNLLIIPGGVFSERDTHLRISFAASDDTIRRGVEILNTLARG